MLNNEPDFPANEICPSGNTSRLILEDALPLNWIVGLPPDLLGVIIISGIIY